MTTPDLSSEISRHTLRWTGTAAAVVAALLLAGGSLRLFANERQARSLQTQIDVNLKRTVTTINARPADPTRSINLPATLRGNEESIIYARTTGYVAAWHKTIGDSVRKGELLAELSAPEQEQALLQARAARDQSNARAALSQGTLARWETQLQSHVVSRQAYEEKRSEAQQAQADLSAAEANVQRLEQLLALQRIVAPFDGVITRRTIDVGAMVTAGGNELFAVTQTHLLRLTVPVPQVYANEVSRGQPATITLEEFPGRSFAGRIEHVSGGLDATTRTREIEIIVPNTEGRLLPGSYATVNLALKSSVGALIIPPSALIVDQDGTRVILVDDRQRLRFRTIRLGRDLGKQLEVLDGLTAQDAIVLNPSDLLQEGESVSVRHIAAEDKKRIS